MWSDAYNTAYVELDVHEHLRPASSLSNPIIDVF